MNSVFLSMPSVIVTLTIQSELTPGYWECGTMIGTIEKRFDHTG
jgi:hypothetical protein